MLTPAITVCSMITSLMKDRVSRTLGGPCSGYVLVLGYVQRKCVMKVLSITLSLCG